MLILQGNSCSIAQKSGEIWTVQTDLQQIYPKSDRLLVTEYTISSDDYNTASARNRYLGSFPATVVAVMCRYSIAMT